ncbi:unnamed protein product [Gordionus sp. m RMFG-2023]|uniref:GTP-binding protein 10-like n=1 Tax=Gordionus sp. m RMFG-2023 TaxID=3053472 RepID=UPI0030DE5E0B
MQKKFIDNLKILAFGGTGGNGILKYNGKGGKGGDVLASACSKTSLNLLANNYPNKKIKAEPGDPSRMFELQGKPGRNTIIHVPLGSSFYYINDNKQTNKFKHLGDVNKINEQILLAKGGEPGFEHNLYNGQPGECNKILIELKLLADVGLVGLPNAGKSTLLKSLTNAHPKIANYPFTTLTPQIGILEYKSDFRKISIADLPGLIEGASLNNGLGHSFLKHIERTKLLLYLVDIHGFSLDIYSKYMTAIETLQLLIKEIELYNKALLEKPSILVLNKIDINKDTDIKGPININQKFTNISSFDQFSNDRIKFHEIFEISAKNKVGLQYLKQRIRVILDDTSFQN